VKSEPDTLTRKILDDPLLFGPEIGTEARNILTGLLTRDPARRLGANGAKEIKKHPFFERHINFRKLLQKEIQPPFKPSVVSPVVRVVSLSYTPEVHVFSKGCVQLRYYVYRRTGI
jgi:hypothetical protein